MADFEMHLTNDEARPMSREEHLEYIDMLLELARTQQASEERSNALAAARAREAEAWGNYQEALNFLAAAQTEYRAAKAAREALEDQQ